MASTGALAPRPRLNALCVFCGSQAGRDPAFAAAARELGRRLAAHGAALVFGGGRVGLMGVCADAALAGGGRVIGVIPEFLKDKELAHAAATEMIVVPDMHTRKKAMFDRADAAGQDAEGVGTLDEFFEIVTWRQLHRHNKPIVVLNVAGYWSNLRDMMAAIVAQGFAHAGHEALITVVDDAAAVIATVEAELAAPKPAVLFKV